MSRFIESFTEMMVAERGSSPRTIEAYTRDLNALEEFLVSHKRNLETATSTDLKAFISSIAEKKMAVKTQQRKLSSIREFYLFLFSEGTITDNPATNLDGPKTGKPLPKYLTENEVLSLIEVAKKEKGKKGLRLVAMLEILYASGIRATELVELSLSAVTNDKSVISVLGKGGKERAVPLSIPARMAISKYLAVRDDFLKKGRKSKWLFPSTGKSGHITRDGFFKMIKDIAIKAGVDKSKVSPHVFRHSFASHLLDHGADLRSIQQMMGHSDISSTEIYTHIQDEKLKNLVEKHHPLANKKS